MRIRPFVEPKRPPKTKQPPQVWTGPTLSAEALAAPIRVITGPEFMDAAKRTAKYYRGRAGYMSVAAAAADELIETYGLRSALELGPHLRPLVVGADVMDYRELPDLEVPAKVIIHDARWTPWPMEDDASTCSSASRSSSTWATARTPPSRRSAGSPSTP